MIQQVGFLKLHRSLFSKPIWLNSTVKQQVILLTLMAMANFKDNEWEWKGQKYTVKAGQFITSIESIIANTGGNVSPQNVRTAIKRFEKLGFLTNESASQGRLITIVNWEYYQTTYEHPNIVTNKHLTKGSQMPNKDLTPKEEGKKTKKNNKVRKVKEIYKREGTIPYGEFKNVYLKESEKEKLVNMYGLQAVNEQIESLSSYIENNEKGKKYQNHYAALKTWCKDLPKKPIAQEHDKNTKEANIEKLVKYYGEDWEKEFDEINF